MWSCALAVVLTAVSSAAQASAPVVDTPLGRVSGSYLVSRAGRTFAAFNKIPFAEPPVGELRFQAPEPIENWNGTYDATVPLPRCAQTISWDGWKIVGQEDCLYLSVFTHNVSGKAPVLVYIHGGAFAMGNAARGPKYLMDENLVVVLVNYRLGILGFLSFEDDTLPGNQGMKDQVEALRWVKANIASFGGDPNLVTIIGESAGGASVYHHIVSPLSKGLFHRGISESGTSYAIWALAPPGYAKSNAESLLKNLNCSTENLKEGLKCIRKKNSVDILNQLKNLFLLGASSQWQFGPVLEKSGSGAFLAGPINEWKHEPVPLLMGITSAEGIGFGKPLLNQNWTKFTADFFDIAPKLYGYLPTTSNPNDVTKKIREYYLKNPNITLGDWVNLTTICTDLWFTVPGFDGANKHSGDVFFYYFDYILKELTPWINQSLIYGAVHTAESYFIWEPSDEKPNKVLITRKEDIDLSVKLVKIVANFAKFGNPIQNTSTDLNTWKKWTKNEPNYIHINKTGAFLQKKGLFEGRYDFWKSVNYKDNYKDTTENSALKNYISVYLFIIIAFLQLI